MKVFGLTVPSLGVIKAAFAGQLVNVASLYGMTSSWLMGAVREPFAGAWQRNVIPESRQNLLAFSAVYACVTLIAEDVSKLRIKLVQQQPSGVWTETDNPAFSPVLRKPNRYQTRIQFLMDWVLSVLIHGNAYIYKERDNRGIVTDLYVLNPLFVTPMIGTDGSVWYRLKSDYLSGVGEGGPTGSEVTVPADAIIHDRAATLWHPLIGVSPIYAAGASATQGIRIQAQSARFFENMSRPSGHLTSPNIMPDALLARLKKEIDDNTTGSRIGGLMITGGGLKYEPFAMIPAADAQLIEQLRWTVEDVARCYKVPQHKIATAQAPSFNNIGALDQAYYSQCLQHRIEAIELLLEEGLGIGADQGSTATRTLGVELDLKGLLRMDPGARADANQKNVTAGVTAPNEARLDENLEPVEGGDTPYMQQQMVPLALLAKGPPEPKPAALPAPAAAPTPPSKPPEAPPSKSAPSAEEMETARVFAAALIARWSESAHGH